MSVVFGRIQKIENIELFKESQINISAEKFDVHPSYQWMLAKNRKLHKPHPGDLPLNPYLRREEFFSVLQKWISTSDDWRISRNRYLRCLNSANKYNVDRLVAAANMFDLLPKSAKPTEKKLSNELVNVRDECLRLLKKLPIDTDVQSVLGALGRMGKVSLPKIVEYRTSIIQKIIGEKFPNIDIAANIAVKLRNYYVHGSKGNLDFAKIEPLSSFLTDVLEFVFIVSYLIECGWDANRWSMSYKGYGHSFTRFEAEYFGAMRALQEKNYGRISSE